MPILVVAPHWGAWIEIDRLGDWSNVVVASHPTGVRGLKYLGPDELDQRRQSHPTGVRGLKYALRQVGQSARRVAPHWGAWIEIDLLSDKTVANASRTPLGCVD